MKSAATKRGSHVETSAPCPSCGMTREDWPDQEGYVKDGETFCCRGCADGTGCTCPDFTER